MCSGYVVVRLEPFTRRSVPGGLRPRQVHKALQVDLAVTCARKVDLARSVDMHSKAGGAPGVKAEAHGALGVKSRSGGGLGKQRMKLPRWDNLLWGAGEHKRWHREEAHFGAERSENSPTTTARSCSMPRLYK